jgi:hypothetical protein
MTNIAGSGSISQRHGSEDPDPDPPQNVMDPQHWSWVSLFCDPEKISDLRYLLEDLGRFVREKRK